MELTLVGLQNSGKTTLVNVIAVSVYVWRKWLFILTLLYSQGSSTRIRFQQWVSIWEKSPKETSQWSFGILEDNLGSEVCGRDIAEGCVLLCKWQYKWEEKEGNSTRGNRFVVDAADHDKLEAAKSELKALLDRPQLVHIPLLILGNKNDLEGALTAEQLIDIL